MWSYAVCAGLLADGEFSRKLAAVKALPEAERTLINSATIELQAALAASRKTVPLSTVHALQDGWRPGRERLSDKFKNAAFVFSAVLLMIAASQLTLTYKSGEVLFAELSLLKDKRPGLQYGKLERQLLVARHQLQADVLTPAVGANGAKPLGLPGRAGAGSPAQPNGIVASQADGGNVADLIQQDLIAQDASFQYVHDLTMLDEELELVKFKSDAFLAAADAQLGVLNQLTTSFCWFGVSIGWQCPDSLKDGTARKIELTSEEIKNRYRMQYAPFDLSSVQNFCQYLDDIEMVRSKGWKNAEASAGSPNSFIIEISYLFDDALGIDTLELMRQNCQMNLKYYSLSIPNIIDMQNKIEARLATYSYLALPALYGALGSLLYFMQRILDPVKPNPTLLRMIYRVAMGALAGMVLAWFWDGTFNNNEAFQTIGFGLFTLAFVFGFAIDVFFNLLNRFVQISTDAVSKIGASA